MSQELESQGVETEKYIRAHIQRVQKWLSHFSRQLYIRGSNHDASKLQSPEIEGWSQMDLEPRYPYGSPEYEDKKRRYEWLFHAHYSRNRHHPEYFDIHDNKTFEMDLLDLIELLCDWNGYRDSIRYTEASALVDQQCKRYGFSDELHDLLLNTLRNYFVDFGDFGELPGEEKKVVGYSPSGPKYDIKAEDKPHVDILA
jgi:hypothetical protein